MDGNEYQDHVFIENMQYNKVLVEAGEIIQLENDLEDDIKVNKKEIKKRKEEIKKRKRMINYLAKSNPNFMTIRALECLKFSFKFDMYYFPSFNTSTKFIKHQLEKEHRKEREEYTNNLK
jgi:hypothetical protein